MSFIRSRLRRAEMKTLSSNGGRCPACGLRPAPLDKGYIVVDGKDPVPEMPTVCPECGRNTRMHIKVVYGEEGEGA